MAKIFLTGYMGSGKTTAGKKLSQRLGYEFIDLDQFIEKEHSMKIPEIFRQKGEEAFRAMENNALKKLLTQDNLVIACGGGTPCYYGNMDLMNQNGITIYLKMSTDALFSRLSQSKGERPILSGKTDKELHDFIGRQLEKREDFYHKAQFTVKGKDLDMDALVSFVEDKVTKAPV